MSCWIDTDIRELELKIPKKDFPLKSNLIIGFEFPEMKYPDGECSYDSYASEEIEDFFVFKVKEDDSMHWHENYSELLDELQKLVIKYKGTMIADSTDEEDNTEYIRIRDGVKKKVKIIEEV